MCKRFSEMLLPVFWCWLTTVIKYFASLFPFFADSDSKSFASSPFCFIPWPRAQHFARSSIARASPQIKQLSKSCKVFSLFSSVPFSINRLARSLVLSMSSSIVYVSGCITVLMFSWLILPVFAYVKKTTNCQRRRQSGCDCVGVWGGWHMALVEWLSTPFKRPSHEHHLCRVDVDGKHKEWKAGRHTWWALWLWSGSLWLINTIQTPIIRCFPKQHTHHTRVGFSIHWNHHWKKGNSGCE